jgi:hypothetical protein
MTAPRKTRTGGPFSQSHYLGTRARASVHWQNVRMANLKRLATLLLFLALVLLSAMAQNQSPQPTQKAQAEAQPPKDKGPSFEDTEKWIQDHIGDSGFPAVARPANGAGLAFSYDDAPYVIKFDGCDMHLSIATHTHTTDTTPINAQDDNSRDTSSSLSFTLPLGKLVDVWSMPLPVQDYVGQVAPGSGRDVPSVFMQLPDAGGVGTFSTVTTSTGMTTLPPVNNKRIEAGYLPMKVCNVLGGCRTVQGIPISYVRPGTDDAPPHMAKALKHLVEICRENPDSAPKDLF